MMFTSCQSIRWARSAAFAAAALLLLAGSAAADTIIAISPFGGGLGGANTHVLQVQTSPFSVSTLGAAGVPSLSGLAIQPGTGTLFASSGFGGTHPGSLFALDPHTGAATFIGQSGFGLPGVAPPAVTALTFDRDGTLFGASGVADVVPFPVAGTELIKINPTTGAGTIIGPFGMGIDGMAALAVDPTTGILYGGGAETPTSPGVFLNLFTIDRGSGAAHLLGPLVGTDPTAQLSGLAFDSVGHLFGSLSFPGNAAPSTPGLIGSIDLASRQFTPLGPTGNSVSDIAVLQTVPEPTGLALWGLGALALLGYRRRRCHAAPPK